MGNGEDSGTWGSITNTNWNLIEQSVAGVQTITMANANYTLSNLNGVSDEARNMVLVVNGTNSAIYQIIAPLVNKFYVVSNQTVGGYAITIGGSSGAIITVPSGTTVQVYCDGSNFYSAQTSSAGNFNVNGNLTVSGTFNYVPTGTLNMWPLASAPAGFLKCDGSAISRTTYSALYAVIGTTFGVGDGSTTFNLPNYTDRMPIGAGNLYAIAATGGSKDATLVSHNHGGATGGQSASHYHYLDTYTQGQTADHVHGPYGGFQAIVGATGGPPGGGYANLGGDGNNMPSTGPTSNDHAHHIQSNTNNASNDHTHSISTDGSSATNANLPPYLGINFIIKT